MTLITVKHYDFEKSEADLQYAVLDDTTHTPFMPSVSGMMITSSGAQADVKYAAVSANTSGNNTLVPAVSGKKIRVLSMHLHVDADVSIRIEDGASGTALTGVMQMHGTGAVNGDYLLSYNPHGHYETSANTLLNLELSGAVQVSGHLSYIEV